MSDVNGIVFSNWNAFNRLFIDTMNLGVIVSPRGSQIRELLDTQISIDPRYPFQGFKNRKYNFEYFKTEMRWKLGASKMDASIKDHATMWASVQNPDGSFNSNYGQFWFGQQMGFFKVVMELIRDQDSRRACIPMLRDDHLSPETTDTVCTESVTFHIREEKLWMSVHMRSSDQIFGLGTDIPTFSVLYMLVLGVLKDTYPWLQIGRITLTAASSHIYSKHWTMVTKCIDEDFAQYSRMQLPEPYSSAEALAIIAHRGKMRPVETSWFLYEFIHG